MDEFKSPLYLGKSRATSADYFLVPHPNGMRGFVRHAGTPVWCISSILPDFLDESLAEESVVKDVVKFVVKSFEDSKSLKKGQRADPTKVTPQVKPALEKSKGNINAANCNVLLESSAGTDSGTRSSEETATSLPNPEAGNLDFGRDIISSSSPSECSVASASGRRGRKPRQSLSEVFGLPGDGYGGVVGKLPDRNAPESPEQSGRRLESDGRVLGTRRSDPESTNGSSSDKSPVYSSVDGSVKPKRKRRTKLEMEAARAAEAAALLAK